MNAEKFQNRAVSFLRMAVGWHFLYEGLVKLLNPGWSAAGYLSGANWLFSGVFQNIASNPEFLLVINFLNIWGLILIGAGLLLGIGIRIASIAGVLLLLLYYLVNPSLIGVKFNSITTEGSYLIINKNIIEALVLVVVVFYPLQKQAGLHLLFRHFIHKKSNHSEVKTEPVAVNAPKSKTRRDLLQGLVALPVAALFGFAFFKKKNTVKIDSYTGATTLIVPDKSVKELTKDNLFLGRIGEQEISRLILGGGCFTGWQHARDLKYVNELASTYNTQQRLEETLKLADELGINTVNIYTQQLPAFQRFREKFNHNLKLMVAVAVNKHDLFMETDQALKAGASLIYIQPGVSDRLIFYNEPEVISKAIDYIRKSGLPAGIGCYSIKTVEAFERFGMIPDFYVKSIHPDNYWSANPKEFREEFDPAFQRFYPEQHRFHDNIFDLFPEKTIETMSRLSVPWIGFKTLASGAILPEEGFRFAFENGADFISAGMFDFQIERNIKTTFNVLKSTSERNRNWFA